MSAEARPPRRGRLDATEWLTFAAFAAFGVAVIAGMLLRVRLQGGVATGADSYVTVDQLQYLNWIRQASDHVAVKNLYDLADSSRSFVHPGVLLAALLHRLGLGLVESFQALKLLAIPLLFGGTLLYVRRFLEAPRDRHLALVVALFSVSPVAAAAGWSHLGSNKQDLQLDFMAGEIWTGHYLWGYMFTAIAVALMPLTLLAYERGRAGGGRGMLAAAAAAGLLCAWLQPWQGAALAFIVVGAEVLLLRHEGPESRSPGRAARDVLPVVLAIAVPLLYYWILSRTDSTWELAGSANAEGGWPLWVMVVGLAPLAVPALLAYRLPAPEFGSLALRLWPVAALLVFYLPTGTFPAHAMQGITIPLVVLAALAIRHRLGARMMPAALALAIIGVMVVPGVIYRVDKLRGAVKGGLQPFFLEDGEHDALRHLAAVDEKGGVLTTFYSGQAVPAYAGRATWLGATSWTPHFKARRDAATRLFSGELDRAAAARLIERSGARFLYSDCQGHPDISATVAGVAGPPQRFGCATVYRVRRGI